MLQTMHCGCWRDRRALALIGVLLLAASSAREAFTFERAIPNGPERDEITAVRAPSDSDPDSKQVSAARVLARQHETNVAPPVPESRQPAELRYPSSPPTPIRELAAGERAERIASRPGRSAIVRWCIAHATSTQAP